MAEQMAAMQVEIDNKDEAAQHQAEATQDEVNMVGQNWLSHVQEKFPVCFRGLMTSNQGCIASGCTEWT